MEPRVILVTRPTPYEELLHRHGTHGQAAWFLGTRGQQIDAVVAIHEQQERALEETLRAIPRSWRRARIGREALDRFLFEPDDIVVAVGQDGLVANVAKYLDGQPVIGVNPDPRRYEGVLVRHDAGQVASLLPAVATGRCVIAARTMVSAKTDDGQELLALNEVFIGQRTHQSARYVVSWGEQQERHSSSGLIVATGTGATGWARSIHQCHRSTLRLPGPTDPELVFFVREAWPSVNTGTSVTEGVVAAGASIRVVSEMGETGVLFGDGIEQDPLPFPWAREVVVSRASRTLQLVQE